MKLETLCQMSGLEMPMNQQVSEQDICAITCNSRTCVPGCLYVCISGTQVDGHAFIEEALAKGAAAVVTERNHPMVDRLVEKRGSAVFLSCEDTRAMAAHLFYAWYGQPAKRMRLVGVTGTNGKTSVTSMLCSVLQQAGRKCGLIGTLGSRVGEKEITIRSRNECANMTTPDPEELYHILSVMEKEGVDTVVMEVSSHALALRKLAPLLFDTAIFTNFTQDHLDFHGSMRAYFEAKSTLFERASYAVLNADDDEVFSLVHRLNIPFVTVSAIGREADICADAVEMRGCAGVAYTLTCAEERVPLRCSVPGTFTVSNTLMAVAAARHLGVSFADISSALAHFAGVCGRMERVPAADQLSVSVFIDYAHTPDALEKLLLCAKGFRAEGQRILLLFGCGGNRDPKKRPIMGRIAATHADHVYLTADNCRGERVEDILSDIQEGIPAGSSVSVIPDRKQAIYQALLDAKEGDILLLAGKGHEKYEIDQNGKHFFDERAVVQEAVEARINQ